MAPYNPAIHHRRSIRLKGYDYAQAGLYFVTLCVQDRICLFGEVANREMHLNDSGRMIQKWYNELESKFPDIECGEMVVMPNHFHCIIKNVGADRRTQNLPFENGDSGIDMGIVPGVGTGAVGVVGVDLVGVDLRVDPNTPTGHSDPILGDLGSTGSILGDLGSTGSILGDLGSTGSILGEHGSTGSILGEHVGSPLSRVVQWFKTMTTNEYIRGVKNLGWRRFNGKLWQRNYYEHIIRNQPSYERIAEYIRQNPSKWDEDRLA